MKRTAMLSGAAFAIFFCGAGLALAQDQTQDSHQDHHGQDFRSACASDMQTYCASAQSRDDRFQCMRTNQDKFSDTCKAAMASHGHHRDHGGWQSHDHSDSTDSTDGN